MESSHTGHYFVISSINYDNVHTLSIISNVAYEVTIFKG